MDGKKIYIDAGTPSGCLEFLPEEQIEFERIKGVIESVYRGFGFSPLDTPALERTAALLAKEKEEPEAEARKNIYLVHNRNADFNNSEAGLGLRFDLTVPLARYAALHCNDLSFPFRRYHIAKVYRGERAAHGRFREFYQCDIDVIGRDKLSINYDAEMPAIIYSLFRKLAIGKFTIRICNRKLHNGLLKWLGISSGAAVKKTLAVIDESAKMPEEFFYKSLAETGLDAERAGKLASIIKLNCGAEEAIGKLKNIHCNDEQYLAGIEELRLVIETMRMFGVEEDFFKVDLSVVRGLDYYTGTVYETTLDGHSRLGSVCSGGRYEDLAALFTKIRLPGVGISIGLSRLFFQLRELGLINCAHKSAADVIVVPFDGASLEYSLGIAKKLRSSGWNVDVLFEDLKKKFSYVDKKNPRFTIIAGSEEVAAKTARLQYKSSGSLVKVNVPLANLSEELKSVARQVL